MNEITMDLVLIEKKYMPTYAHPTDACRDLKLRINEGTYTLKPGESKMFGTGIKVKVPQGFFMMLAPRSSTAKIDCMLANTIGIIDSDYRDEVKIVLHNYGSKEQILSDEQRIAQFVILKYPYVYLNFVKDDEKFREGDRGGGFGSSGK